MKIYGIYDEKLEDFCEVFPMPTDLMAIRAFGEQCNKEGTPLYKFPKDYELRFIEDTKLPYDAEQNKTKTLITAEECRVYKNEKNTTTNN